MPIAAWPLAQGAAVTRWLMSEAVESHFPGQARPMPDRVDYRFINGFVDVGELPCREAWRAATEVRIEPRPDGLDFAKVYAGPAGGDIDFSTFRARPTLIRRYLRVAIHAPEPRTVGLELTTCGRLQLWCGGEPPICLAPRERNRRTTETFACRLQSGWQEITLMLEDLHERDTLCMFALRLRDAEGLREAWATGAGERVEVARAAMQRGEARLTGRYLCWRGMVPDAEYTLADLRPFERGGLWALAGNILPQRLTGRADAAGVCQFDLGMAPPAGAYALRMVQHVDGLCIERRSGMVARTPMRRLAGATLAARKAEAINLSQAAMAIDPSTALLSLASGGDVAHACRVIEQVLPGIQARQDCSDFNIIPLLLIWRHHQARLPAAIAKRLRATLTGFRYWLDRPGDDVMWFWSENHVLCFHVAHCLALHSGLGDQGVGDRLAEVEARLHRWFDAIARDGLAEWNSAAYYPIDLLALFALRDGGCDAALAARAERLLDDIFVMMALHSSGGVPAGSQGRAYEKELLAGPATELGPVAAVAFGGAFATGFDRAVALFCLSDYAPPAIASELACPVVPLRASYRQGADGSGQLDLWKSAAVQLSTARGARPGSPGHQQHVIDIQFAADPWARLWINAAGDHARWGDRRPSYLAGNAVMPALQAFGATALLIYQDCQGPINAHLGQGAIEHGQAGDWRLLRCGAGHAALWCSMALSDADDGVVQARGRDVAWVVRVGEDADFERFAETCRNIVPVFDAVRGRLTCAEMALDADGRGWLAGRPLPMDDLPVVARFGWRDGPLRSWREYDDKASLSALRRMH